MPTVQGSLVEIDDWLRSGDDREGQVTGIDEEAGLITLRMNIGGIRVVSPDDAHWNPWDPKAPH